MIDLTSYHEIDLHRMLASGIIDSVEYLAEMRRRNIVYPTVGPGVVGNTYGTFRPGAPYDQIVQYVVEPEEDMRIPEVVRALQKIAGSALSRSSRVEVGPSQAAARLILAAILNSEEECLEITDKAFQDALGYKLIVTDLQNGTVVVSAERLI